MTEKSIHVPKIKSDSPPKKWVPREKTPKGGRKLAEWEISTKKTPAYFGKKLKLSWKQTNSASWTDKCLQNHPGPFLGNTPHVVIAGIF